MPHPPQRRSLCCENVGWQPRSHSRFLCHTPPVAGGYFKFCIFKRYPAAPSAPPGFSSTTAKGTPHRLHPYPALLPLHSAVAAGPRHDSCRPCTYLCVCQCDATATKFSPVSASPKQERMPHWALSCRNCHKNFVHSEIAARSTELPYDTLWPDRPEFPAGGLSVQCPHCQETSNYQRFELMYQPA